MKCEQTLGVSNQTGRLNIVGTISRQSGVIVRMSYGTQVFMRRHELILHNFLLQHASLHAYCMTFFTASKFACVRLRCANRTYALKRWVWQPKLRRCSLQFCVTLY